MTIEALHLISIIGFTLDTSGKVLVAYTTMQVHYRFWQEHKVDERVFREMRHERRIAILGIALMVLGFVLQLPAKLNGTLF